MLKFMPTSEKDKLEFKCMCDSDYAGDKDNRLTLMDVSHHGNHGRKNVKCYPLQKPSM